MRELSEEVLFSVELVCALSILSIEEEEEELSIEEEEELSSIEGEEEDELVSRIDSKSQLPSNKEISPRPSIMTEILLFLFIGSPFM